MLLAKLGVTAKANFLQVCALNKRWRPARKRAVANCGFSPRPARASKALRACVRSGQADLRRDGQGRLWRRRRRRACQYVLANFSWVCRYGTPILAQTAVACIQSAHDTGDQCRAAPDAATPVRVVLTSQNSLVVRSDRRAHLAPEDLQGRPRVADAAIRQERRRHDLAERVYGQGPAQPGGHALFLPSREHRAGMKRVLPSLPAEQRDSSRASGQADELVSPRR